MKALITLSLTILIALLPQAQAGESIMGERWSKLMGLVNEELRTIKMVKNPGPGLKFRMLELYSEKIALLREEENQKFLQSPPEVQKKRGKKSYFNSSQETYQMTLKLGKEILRDYPNFSQTADVHYVIALNSRDFSNDNLTEKHLLKVLSLAQMESELHHLASVAIAENYYNEKNFKSALKHYKIVIQNKNDQWYAKHHYNMGWCTFKTMDYTSAIELLEQSQELGKNTNYVPVTDQVLQSLLIFYVHAKEIKRGVDFYQDNSSDAYPHLLKMAKKASEKGLFEDSRYILEKTHKLAKKDETGARYYETALLEMDIVRQYFRNDLFFQLAVEFKEKQLKLPMKEEQRLEAVDKIKSLVGFMQIKLAKDSRKNDHRYSETELKQIIKYFDVLSTLDPKNSDEYAYFQGETYYSVGINEEAGKSYQSALEISKKNNATNLEIKKKIINALLSVVGSGDLTPKRTMEWTIYGYENHLVIWPVGEKSTEIYQDLFKLYLKEEKIADAVRILENFVVHYPALQVTQREMLTRVLDKIIAKKDSDNLSLWLARLEKGFLGFDTAYIEKATIILGEILFENLEGLEKKGMKAEAAKGHIALFENPKYPKLIKAKTAYKAAVLYLDAANTEKSVEWLNQSFNHYRSDETFALVGDLAAMAQRLYLLQDFERAGELSWQLLQKFCSKSYPQSREFLMNSIHFNLILGKSIKAVEQIKRAERCTLQAQDLLEAKKLALLEFSRERKFDEFYNLYHDLRQEKALKGAFLEAMIDIYWDSFQTQDKSLRQKTMRILRTEWEKGLAPEQQSLSNKIGNIFELMGYETKVEKLSFRPLGPKGKNAFDISDYNKYLEGHLKELKVLTDEGTALIKRKDAQVGTMVYAVLIEKYEVLAADIAGFTPKVEDQKFLQQFKGQMQMLSGNLEKKVREFLQIAQQSIESGDILAHADSRLSVGRKIASMPGFNYPAGELVAPISRAGGKP